MVGTETTAAAPALRSFGPASYATARDTMRIDGFSSCADMSAKRLSLSAGMHAMSPRAASARARWSTSLVVASPMT